MTLRKYVITYDVGRAVNPMIVDGQLVGALAQGLGGALFEELVYDEQGQLLTTTFMDYLVPTAMEMPAVTIVRILEETPTPLNPLGVKGVGRGRQLGRAARPSPTRSPTRWSPLGVGDHRAAALAPTASARWSARPKRPGPDARTQLSLSCVRTPFRRYQARSKRSRFITLFHADTKSRTNAFCESSHA